jgi:diacylglycerol O-acyltransferase / wax synthase
VTVCRLTGLDAAFLAIEGPGHPMHTLKLLVLAPLGETEPLTDAALAAAIAGSLHLVPEARRRVLPIPHGLHHPVWLEDPDFELGAHLKRRTLSAPGTKRELDAAIGEIAEMPLDRSRPLWELWVLEGLGDRRVALLVKVHHAVADGMTVARRLATVTSGEIDGALAPAEGRWVADEVPSNGALVRDALVERVRQVALLKELVLRTGRGLASKLERRRRASTKMVLPVLDAPRSPMNGALTSRRAFASAWVVLEDVRRVKEAFDVTFHDVVLALATSALRDHLKAEGALPGRPLLASVPTSEAPANNRGGNHVSSLFVPLPTHIEDPVARLSSIRRDAASAKAGHRALGSNLMEAWAEHIPPSVLHGATSGWARTGLANHLPPPLNVIVSSVPGPTTTRFLPGYRLEELYSVGPLLEGIGVNITAWSYLDRLFIGVLTCPELLADPSALTESMRSSLVTLLRLMPS